MIKKRLLACGLLLALALSLTACFPNKNKASELLGTAALPTRYAHVDYFINFNSLPIRIGDADYVFVAEAAEYIKTEHEMDRTTQWPITFYGLKVIENIKGELSKEGNVVAEKEGGIGKNGQFFAMIHDDILPKIGNYYVFALKVSPEHNLYASGTNTNFPLKSGTDYKNEKSYKQVIAAYENQEIVYKRERYLSKYDVNYAG